MSNNGNDDKLSAGQIFLLSALFVGAAVVIFALVRWMVTTKAGMITAAVAFVMLLFLYLTGALERPTQAATAAPSYQTSQPSLPSKVPSGYIEQGSTPPGVAYRIDRGQACATLNGVTSCSPINR